MCFLHVLIASLSNTATNALPSLLLSVFTHDELLSKAGINDMKNLVKFSKALPKTAQLFKSS